MINYRDLYNSKYRNIKNIGWSGWGCQDRENQGFILLERILSNQYIPKTGVGLEIGCGEGQLSRKLSTCGFNMTGVDISDVALRWGIKKNRGKNLNVNYFQADISEDNIKLGGLYDLIVDGNCWLFGISRGHPQDVVFCHTDKNPVLSCKSI